MSTSLPPTTIQKPVPEKFLIIDDIVFLSEVKKFQSIAKVKFLEEFYTILPKLFQMTIYSRSLFSTDGGWCTKEILNILQYFTEF